jgi:hypothetical protein
LTSRAVRPYGQPIVIGLRRGHAALFVTASLLLTTFLWLLAADDDAHVAQRDDGLEAEESRADLVPTPVASALRSQWISQSAPKTIALGKTATATLVFRNIGSTAWIRGTAAEARLGIVADDTHFSEIGLALGWPMLARERDRSASPSLTAGRGRRDVDG